jgi:chlorobactene glucosyltransferase
MWLNLLVQLHLALLTFLLLVLIVAISNLLWWRRLASYSTVAPQPRVSVLVPARNEAENITPCLLSLLAQDYAEFEVIVLDDHSTDGTGARLAVLAAGEQRLRVLTGTPLPAGWLGKQWACAQLARAASGDHLLFVDADTRLAPTALREAMAALQAERVGLVTVLPRQTVVTWGERLLVPMLPWSLFCFLPVALAHRLQWPALSASVGQCLLFTRAAYERAGGHAAVRATPVDDIALGKRVMAQHDGWRLLDGGDYVTCRMYRGFREAQAGFGRTLFAAFDDRAVPFVVVWVWLAVVFVVPVVTLGAALAGLLPASFNVQLPLAAIGLSLLLWTLCLRRFGLPLYLAALYPLSVPLMTLTALRSWWVTRTGRVQWRGRALVER